ncbi:MAG TPA: hypothetical protein VFQ57_06935 [Sphingomonas sp.]|jgi:hypothetical protein|nr:hypothetical protein [Sphingomonas sp.]
MQVMTNENVTALIATASSAATVLRQVTTGKGAEDHAETNVRTLTQLTEIVESLAAQLKERQKSGDRLEVALQRVAGLKVRSANELVEQGNWKKLAGELQSIAQSALESEDAAPSMR